MWGSFVNNCKHDSSSIISSTCVVFVEDAGSPIDIAVTVLIRCLWARLYVRWSVRSSGFGLYWTTYTTYFLSWVVTFNLKSHYWHKACVITRTIAAFCYDFVQHENDNIWGSNARYPRALAFVRMSYQPFNTYLSQHKTVSGKRMWHVNGVQ